MVARCSTVSCALAICNIVFELNAAPINFLRVSIKREKSTEGSASRPTTRVSVTAATTATAVRTTTKDVRTDVARQTHAIHTTRYLDPIMIQELSHVDYLTSATPWKMGTATTVRHDCIGTFDGQTTKNNGVLDDHDHDHDDDDDDGNVK